MQTNKLHPVVEDPEEKRQNSEQVVESIDSFPVADRISISGLLDVKHRA